MALPTPTPTITPGSDAWLAQVPEAVIDPGRPIIDPHHHLWTDAFGRTPYLLPGVGMAAGMLMGSPGVGTGLVRGWDGSVAGYSPTCSSSGGAAISASIKRRSRQRPQR